MAGKSVKLLGGTATVVLNLHLQELLVVIHPSTETPCRETLDDLHCRLQSAAALDGSCHVGFDARHERRRLPGALRKATPPLISMLDGHLLRYINSGARLIKVAVLRHLPEQ
jgi:hypothetical protein